MSPDTLTNYAICLLNKATGRPATPETAVLADVTAQLKPLIEDTLGQDDRVAKAVLSSLDHVGLPEE